MLSDTFKTNLPFNGCEHCVEIDPIVCRIEKFNEAPGIIIECRNREICEAAVRSYKAGTCNS